MVRHDPYEKFRPPSGPQTGPSGPPRPTRRILGGGGGRPTSTQVGGLYPSAPTAVPRPVPEPTRATYLLKLYNEYWTDDEIREVFGIDQYRDVTDLRSNLALMTYVNKNWEGRMETYDREVEEGRRPLPEKLREYANELANLDIHPPEDLPVFGPPEADKSPGQMIRSVVDKARRQSRGVLEEEFEPGEVPQGMTALMYASLAEGATFGKGTKWVSYELDAEDVIAQLITETLMNDRVSGADKIRELIETDFSDDQWLKNLFYLKLAEFQEKTFAQQTIKNPVMWMTLAAGGKGAITGLIKGLAARSGTTLAQLGRIPIPALRSNTEVLARNIDTPVRRISDLPGLRALRNVGNPSANRLRLAEGTDDRLILDEIEIFRNLTIDSERFIALQGKQLRSLGNWNKEFGFRTGPDGLSTGRAHNVPGSPATGDLLEFANLGSLRGPSKFRIIAESDEEASDAILRAAEGGAASQILGPVRTLSIFDDATGQPLLNVVAQRVPQGKNVFQVEIQGLDLAGKPLGFADKTFENAFTRNELLDMADSVMKQLGADELVGFRLGREALGVKSVTRAQIDKGLGTVKEILPGHPEVTHLTRKQRDMIQALRDAYADALKMQIDEGVPVNELYKFQDGVHYIARKVKGEWGLYTSNGVSKAAHLKSRGRTDTGLVKTMEEQLKEGRRYLDPLETFDFYMTETYRTVVHRRMASHLEGVARDVGTPEALKLASKLAKMQTTRQGKSIQVVQNMIDGLMPKSATRRMVRGAFPTLADEFDEILSLKTVSPGKIIQQLTTKLGRSLPANQVAFRTAMHEVLGKARITGDIKKTDVSAAIKKMGVTGREQARITRDIHSALVKSALAEKKSRLLTLMGKMSEEADLAKEGRASIDASKAAAIKTFAGTRLGEVTPSRFPGLRLGSELKDGRTQALQNPRKFADKLDRIFDDEGLGPFRVVADLNDALRVMKTTYDFGTAFIQGLPTLFRDPEAWGKSVGMSIRAFADDGVRATYIADNSTAILEMIQHGGHIGSSEFTQSMEAGGWFAKLAVFGQGPQGPLMERNLRGVVTSPIRGFYRGTGRFTSTFDTFLDVARIETYKALRPVALRAEDSAGALNALSSFVNKVTGTIDSRALGVSTTQRQVESAMLMFSPRYTRATVALLSDIFRGGMTGTEARVVMARLLAGQYALHIAAAAALDQEVNLVPGKGNWLKVQIGDQWIGFGGKPNSLINMITDISEQLASSDRRELLSFDMFSQDTYDQSSILRRARYQLPIVAGTFVDIMTHTDPIGKRLLDEGDAWDLSFWAEQMGSKFGPFWLDAAVEAGGGGNGLWDSVLAGSAEIGGGVTWPVAARTKRDKLRDEKSLELYNMSFKDLKDDLYFGAKNATLNADPEIKKLNDEAEEEARHFTRNEERFEIQDLRAGIDRKFVGALNSLANGFPHDLGERPGGAFRQAYREHAIARRASIKTLRDGHEKFFTDKDDYYTELAVGNKVVAATNAFLDKAFASDVLGPDGRPRPGAIRAVKAEIEQEFGKAASEAADSEAIRRLKSLGLPDIVLEYIRSWDVLESYWEAYRTVLPKDQWAAWEAFDAVSETQKDILRAGGRFRFADTEAQIEQKRLEMRQKDFETDRHLVTFYDRAPVNPELIRHLSRAGNQ